MTATLTRENARAGVPLAMAGGLPPVRNARSVEVLEAAKPLQAVNTPALAQVQDVTPSLARILRPQAAYRWLLPYLAAITPQYVEGILRGALAGNHVQAWELFDLMSDTNPEILACIGEYIDGVTQKPLIIEPYHEEDQEPTASAVKKCKIVSAALKNMRPDPALDENNFKAQMRDILFGRFHGQSILELDWYSVDGSTLNTVKVDGVGNIACPRTSFWVHPVCYAWDMNGKLGLRMALQNQLQEISRTALNQRPGNFSMTEPPAWNWISSQPMPSMLMDFPQRKFLISIFKAATGTALRSSCLRSLAWWWVVYNFTGDWLLDLAQIFGIPFRKGKYQQGTPEPEKAEAREMLQNMGSRGWCLLDERVDIEFEKAMEQGASSPQGYLMELAERQFRKVILRQTMTGNHGTMGKGGGQAFGEVESVTKHECIQAGADFGCDLLRDQYARYVLQANLNDDSELPTIRLMEEDEGTLDDANIIAALAPLNQKLIGVNFVRKKFKIPKPADDEDTMGALPEAKEENITQQRTDLTGKAPKPKPETPAGEAQPGTQSQVEAAAMSELFASIGKKHRAVIKNISTALDAAETIKKELSPALAPEKDRTAIAEAISDTLKPLVNYLAKGLEISDPHAQQEYFKRALAKWPQLTGPLQHDTSLQEKLTPILVENFIAGLTASVPPAAPAAKNKTKQ